MIPRISLVILCMSALTTGARADMALPGFPPTRPRVKIQGWNGAEKYDLYFRFLALPGQFLQRVNPGESFTIRCKPAYLKKGVLEAHPKGRAPLTVPDGQKRPTDFKNIPVPEGALRSRELAFPPEFYIGSRFMGSPIDHQECTIPVTLKNGKLEVGTITAEAQLAWPLIICYTLIVLCLIALIVRKAKKKPTPAQAEVG